jgi:hypothetical protein
MEEDIKNMIAIDGEQDINNMHVGQLCRLQRELLRRKSKEQTQ